MANPNVRVTREGNALAGSVRSASFRELRRAMRSARGSRAGGLGLLLRLVFLVRARISGVVVEIAM